MLENVIEWAGGKLKLARRLGVTHSAVSYWVSLGYLPAARAIQIERLSGGMFRAVDLAKPEVDNGEK